MRAVNMRVLSNEIEAAYPGVVIGGIGDLPHQLSPSDHNEDDTAGSKPAQSDPDSNPEHRAIDVMLGPAMTIAQLQAIIDYILARPWLRRRLKYINFLNWQWSASTGWVRHDNSHDPHPGHGHFSGLASNDEDASPWLTELGVTDMPKIVHQDGQGWWVVGNGAPQPIQTEAEGNDLVKAYGPVVFIDDQRHFGIPPAPVPPITITLSEKDKADIIAGLKAFVPSVSDIVSAIGDLQAEASRAAADVLDGQ